MTWPIRGVIEGFYGRPWSWDERIALMRWCHERGMTHYLYAPKDDPLHRDRWREPYERDALVGFERLVEAGTMRVGFGISPGLSIDYDEADDRSALLAKVEQLLTVGVDLVCLALDDIPPRPGLGEAHAELTRWLHERVGERASLVLVPTEYTGTTSTPYLDALAAGVPADVPIGWTGATVVCDRISVADAVARAASLDGRPPLIWDNYPVNDAIMSDRLFLGPLRGRDAGLAEVCSGYVANPMVQPFASHLPLASTAAFLRGDDPERAWREEADSMGIRSFAEACDGEHPRQLIDALARAGHADRGARLAEVEEWVATLDRYQPTAELADEVVAWREQCEHELGVWRCALRTLRFVERGDGARATIEAMGLLYLWPSVRRAAVSVMGPRCSFRPVFGQWPDGSWRYDAASLDEDANATDALVRCALAEVAAWSP
jgi:hyaluronoglucosaminidase